MGATKIVALLAVQLIWTAPRTGGPVEWYEVSVWDAWGDLLTTATTADTCITLALPKVPFRAAVRGWNTDPIGVPRPGPVWSPTSRLYIPPQLASVFYEMGQRTGIKGLTMSIAGAQALTARWTDPPLPHEE